MKWRSHIEGIDISLLGHDGDSSNFSLYYSTNIDIINNGIVGITRDCPRITGIIMEEGEVPFVFDTDEPEYKDFDIRLEKKVNEIDRLIPFMITIDWKNRQIDIE